MIYENAEAYYRRAFAAINRPIDPASTTPALNKAIWLTGLIVDRMKAWEEYELAEYKEGKGVNVVGCNSKLRLICRNRPKLALESATERSEVNITKTACEVSNHTHVVSLRTVFNEKYNFVDDPTPYEGNCLGTGFVRS